MIFVDTWAWVALARKDDQYHAVAQKEHRRLQQSRRRYVTTDFILNETISFLYAKQTPAQAEAFVDGLWKTIDEGVHQLIHVSAVQFRRAWQLRRRYRDKPDISFVDFTSMVVMQDLGLAEIFNGDAHFLQVGLGFRLVP